MKKVFLFLLALTTIFALAACRYGEGGFEGKVDGSQTEQPSEEISKNIAVVTIGDSEFKAQIFENETARAFCASLPMTVRMDATAHEKYFYLPTPFPANSENVGRIEAGDIMLWGDDCLVLFYESFHTAYRYTRIGKIADTNGLSSAVGSEAVTVRFAISENPEMN